MKLNIFKIRWDLILIPNYIVCTFTVIFSLLINEYHPLLFLIYFIAPLYGLFYCLENIEVVNKFDEIISETKHKRLVKLKSYSGLTVYELHVKSNIFYKWTYPYEFNYSWFASYEIAVKTYNDL